MATSDDADQEPVMNQKSDRKGTPGQSLEGLRVNVLTAAVGLSLLASAGITIGLYVSKLGSLDARLDLAERHVAEAAATISAVKQDMALLDIRVRGAEDNQREVAKKLDKISDDVAGIGRLVLIMCQTSQRPGVACSVK